MAKVDCDNTVDPSFVVYILDALYSCGVNGACIQQTTGIQNLRVLDYLNTKVAFPFLPEQQLIAAYLDASCAVIDAVVSLDKRTEDVSRPNKGVLNRQMETLTAYRKSLIHECITGQRRITEAEVRDIIDRAAKLTRTGQREEIHA